MMFFLIKRDVTDEVVPIFVCPVHQPLSHVEIVLL